MRRIDPIADCAVTKPGIDLIDGGGHLFAACLFRRTQRLKQIALAVGQQRHVPKLDSYGYDLAGTAFAPKRLPQSAMKPQKKGSSG